MYRGVPPRYDIYEKPRPGMLCGVFFFVSGPLRAAIE